MSERAKDADRDQQAVGKCPVHGATTNVDVQFPEGGECGICERELENIIFADPDDIEEVA